MPEKPRPDIESFANLVNEGLRPDVSQSASYWTAAFKTSEGFRNTVFNTPFQTLGVYLISKAHEKYEGRDADAGALHDNNLTYQNATQGFATMIALNACDQAYKKFLPVASSLPPYGDVLNVIPHVLDIGHTDRESVKYMRGLWRIDTPPKPEQIARLTTLDEFMQSFDMNALQYLGREILFTHGLKAMEMGAKPDSIDTIISDGQNMHCFNSSIGSCVGKIQGHVRDYYTPERALEISEGSLDADSIALLQQHAHNLLLTRGDMRTVDVQLARAKSPYTMQDIIELMNQVFHE